MKQKCIFKQILSLLGAAFLSVTAITANSHMSAESHQAEVTMISADTPDGSFFSVGKDGFLIKWTPDGFGEHYQLTELEIRLVAVRPNGYDIAVYETDGYSVHRVSVWNWKNLTRRFVKTFSSSITALSFTEKGTLLAVGTATVNGAVYINPTTGNTVSKIKEATGIVNMIQGSSTEKSTVMYSPAGHLSYYNMTNGTRKERFQTEQQLEQVVLFNNNLFCAGVKNDQIYIIESLSGKTVARLAAKSPVLFNAPEDTVLYYTEFDGRTYTLKQVTATYDGTTSSVGSPTLVKTLTGLSSRDPVSCTAKKDSTLLLGTGNGNIYSTDTANSALVSITNKEYDKIYDIAAIGNDFYCLATDTIYKTSYDTGIVETIGTNTGYTNLITYGDNIILWSKGTRKAVSLLDVATKTTTTLFTPQTYIQTLRLFTDKLIYIESNTTVKMYDIETRNTSELYTGTGIQDAVLYGNSELIIGKAASSNPRSPLISVNTVTKETVMLPVSGNVAFALNYNPSSASNPIYGVQVSTGTTEATTTVFAYYPSRKTVSSIMKISGEDTDAFLSLYGTTLYSNIGKNQIRAYDTSNRREIQMNRSASLPLKIARSNTRVAVLNRDGSISWYNPGSSSVLADWYMTVDGMWFEF